MTAHVNTLQDSELPGSSRDAEACRMVQHVGFSTGSVAGGISRKQLHSTAQASAAKTDKQKAFTMQSFLTDVNKASTLIQVYPSKSALFLQFSTILFP